MKPEYENKSRKDELDHKEELFYYKFEREPNKQHLVFQLIAGEYDWKALETSPYNKMVRLHPPGGAITVFVYFKRDEDTPDLEWNEIYRKLPIRRI
ncbi:MAG: hypothetical protein JST89_18010 [Cyanobacteria bacterium SZAS-4]|nr:hypothetical protein [Cyanobacteria bacterium SZAS-4]